MRTLFIRLFWALSLVFSLFLAGCQSTPKPDPTIALAKSAYYPAEIEVTRGEQFHTGLRTMGGEDPEVLADLFAQSVKSELERELPTVMQGEKPAKIGIVLSEASIASGLGRTLVASDSTVSGTLTVFDQETGAAVTSTAIQATDAGAKNTSTFNGIPVGLLASAAVNATRSGEDTRITRMRDAFVLEVKNWLGTE